MHHFPPTAIEVQNWSFSTQTALFAGLTVALFVFSRRHVAGPLWVFVWTSAFVLFAIAALTVIPEAFSTWYGMSLWTPTLTIAVLVISGTALVRRFASRQEFSGDEIRAFWSVGMVVVAIALLIPANSGHRPARLRTQCKNNLKQLGLAMHNFHDVEGHFPAPTTGTPPVSWRLSLLPYLELASVLDAYDTTAAWDAAVNQPLQRQTVGEYDCPARPISADAEGRFLTAYVVPTGDDTLFATSTQGSAIRDVADGTSNTVLIAEACGSKIVWSSPLDVDVTTAALQVDAPGKSIGESDGVTSSYHSGGANLALVDGSVRFVSDDIAPDILRALLTKSGGEEIPDW